MSTPTLTPTPPSSQSPPPSSARSAARPTATFVPYFWEAYNEIVEPRRFDHYLIRRWLPDLGPTGFAIVKALRDRCYHNPATGILRDSCEIDLDELGESIGVSRATIVRELRNNEALAHFVTRLTQFRMVNGKPRQSPNGYRVSMDDPIHEADMAAYDDLRALREIDRQAPPSGKIVKHEDGRVTYGAQNDPHRKKRQKGSSAYEDQNDPHRETPPSYGAQNDPADTTYLQAQNDPADTTYPGAQIEPAMEDLPSGDLLTKDSLTPSAGTPPIYAPQGAGDPEPESLPSPLTIAWSLALAAVEPTLSIPTYNTHVARLAARDLIDLGDAGVEIVVEAPSAFTREWIERKQVAPALAESLTESLGRPVTVRLTQLGALSSSAAQEATEVPLEVQNDGC